MPASKTVDGGDPAEKSASQNSSTTKNWFSEWLLIPTVAILLLIVLFFIGFSGSSGKLNLQKILKPHDAQNGQQEQGVTFDLGDTIKLFESDVDKDRFDEFISSKQFAKAFIFLSGEYSSTPSNDKRETLIKLADYVRANFEEQVKDTDLTIPCREESCGAVFAYSDKLSRLKNAISGNDYLDDTLKENLSQNIDNASLAAGKGYKDSEFNSLLTVFYSLRKEWQATGNEDYKKLAQQTLLVLEEAHKDLYDLVEEKGSFKFVD